MKLLLKLYRNPISISKSFATFLICFSVFIALVSIGVFFQHYYQTKTVINQKLKFQAGRVENTFIDAINYTEHSMRFIAKQITDNHKAHDYQFINRLLVSYRVPDNRIMEFSTFAWANEKHRFIISSNKGFHFDEVLDLSKRDYIPKTITEPFQIHLGSPVVGIYSKKYAIPAGYGVVDENKKYLGAVITSFVVDGLQRKFDELINVDGVSFVLIKKDGFIVSSSPNLDREQLTKQFSSQILKIGNAKSGLLYDAGIFNDKDFGSIYYNNVENYPYTILTIYNKKLQKSEMYDMIFTHIVIFCLLLIVVVLLLFSFYQSLVKPITDISDVAKKISKGDLNVKRMARCRSVEVNQLARAILSIKQFIRREESLKKQLDKTNSHLHSLTKAINHDLRNYISGISGLANIIVESDMNSVQQQEQNKQYARIIANQSEEMLGFACELLDIEIDNLELSKLGKIEGCNIKSLLEEIVFLAQKFIQKQEVKVKLEIPDNLPLLRCDKRRQRQILDNLITNAVKYSPRNSEVRISCQLTEDKKIYIEIVDDGIGMTKEEIEMALSGKGTEIDKSDLDKPIDSHGIGLPLVKNLVDSIGAKMQVESEKGRGTVIKLWFNIDEANAQTKSSNIKNILVADDEEVNLVILERILKDNNYHITKARNGKEVLEILDHRSCDLILMDAKMPELDGISATRIIREGSVFKHFADYKTIPIIAISGNTDQESIKEAMSAGMNAYLAKPFDKRKVLKMIASL